MATRSHIGIVDANNQITYVYCHWDGNPQHHGPILTGFYYTEEKVNALMQLGNLSVLSSEIGEKQNFNDPKTQKDNWCLAYGRDRNEPNTEARTCNFNQYSKDFVIDYSYLFINGEWMCMGCGIPDWTPLTRVLEDMGIIEGIK